MSTDSEGNSDSSSGWAKFASSIEQKQKEDHSHKKAIPPLAPSSGDEWDAFVTGIIASHQTGNGKVPKQLHKTSEEGSPPLSSSEEPSYENTEDAFLPDSPLVEHSNEQNLEEFGPAGETPLPACSHTSWWIFPDYVLADPSYWPLVISEMQFLELGKWLGNNSIDQYLHQHWLKVKDTSAVLYLSIYAMELCA
jgi:hypothetical protein